MKKILIVGGGPSGLTAAIIAKNEHNEVTVMERNSSCGKKLLLTGNGKCNYWNEDQSMSHYHSSNGSVMKNILNEENLEYTYRFLLKLGIVPFIRNGYYYPFSNQSITMKSALLIEAKKKGIKFIHDIFVEGIECIENSFLVKTDNGEFSFDAVILANGSKANPKTGSDGNGYDLLESLGCEIIPVTPSLVQLVVEGDYLKKWHGIRTQVEVSFHDKKESGELQLTDYGVSGICIFNLSRYFTSNEDYLTINFLPFVISDVYNFFESRCMDKSIGEALECVLNYKLVEVLLSICHIPYNSSYDSLSPEEKDLLISTFTKFNVKVVGTKGFMNAQVCAGGLSLEEVNPNTLELKKIPNLYVVGELLDIDGDCGGYNLTNAFVTGILAGKGVSNDSN